MTVKGRILFMEKNEAVASEAAEILTSLGFALELAREGNEAVELYQQSLESGISFDYVFLSLGVRYGMGGRAAMERLSEIDPKVKAVVSSSNPNHPIMLNFSEYGFVGSITKPYSVDKMRDLFQRLLMERGGNESQ